MSQRPIDGVVLGNIVISKIGNDISFSTLKECKSLNNMFITTFGKINDNKIACKISIGLMTYEQLLNMCNIYTEEQFY